MEFEQFKLYLADKAKKDELKIKLENPEFAIFYQLDSEPKDELITFENWL